MKNKHFSCFFGEACNKQTNINYYGINQDTGTNKTNVGREKEN